MKYRTIEITKNIFIDDSWQYTICDIIGDRESKEKTVPSALGYYHFPETMTDEEAFNELRECMVKTHQEEIDRLEKSKKKLQELTWSEP